ncbi:group II intron reverse transcriptase [Dulcicalothrix desertica]|uniref:group II intron reverse transcriptase n=1 Tax=Dulcicalothrix desertica TaxID=32056 RepID=UPI001EFEFEE5|nr:reverse transcriptase domain-containing protein [Dulcicalothrix desertica]
MPTINDRAWQCLVKYALEPAHEATFDANSYGFRTGRSAHDAQKQIFNLLNANRNGGRKVVIELDIEKCFDRISHTTIMDNLIAPKAIKIGIFRCLKAGTNPGYPEQGTPQGGVVSPLLANVALNGIERIYRHHTVHFPSNSYPKGRRITPKTPEKDITYPSIRYADDMVIIIPEDENPLRVLQNIDEFLATRGMKVSAKKTKVTKPTDGFDFLGWHFKYVKTKKIEKLTCVPSEENYESFRKKVKAIVNSSNYGAEVKAEKLAPIIRGWRNYHKHCRMSGSRFSLWFMNHDAYRKFLKQPSIDRYKAESLVKKAFPAVDHSLFGHVKVMGTKSPYDGDITYWTERESKLYDGATSQAIKRQKHKCVVCDMEFMPGERVHLHHVDGNHENWKTNNLVAIHESCHDYVHMGNIDLAEILKRKSNPRKDKRQGKVS